MILAAKDCPDNKKFNVPEWGVDVWLKAWSHGDRISQDFKSENWYEQVLLMTLRDEKNEPVFTAADLPKLREKNSKVIDKVVAECLKHNGVSTEAVEEAEKNSETSQS